MKSIEKDFVECACSQKVAVQYENIIFDIEN
jgi:hypothetical protein